MKTTLQWADQIVLSDQGDDGYPEKLAEIHPRITVIKNPSKVFNERENRLRLLQEARARFGLCVLVSLDADERLSANVLSDHFRDKLLALEPGTAVRIPFANLTPEGSYWEVPLDPICFADDGRSPDNVKEIHFPRTCFRVFNHIIDSELRVLHLQYLNSNRYDSKVRWYQLLEVTQLGTVNPLTLYRKYRHRDAIRDADLREVPVSWTASYREIGIDPLGADLSEAPWWQEDSQKMLHGLSGYNCVLALSFIARDTKARENLKKADSLILHYLEKTQRYYRPSKTSPLFLLLFCMDLVLAQIVTKFRSPV